MISYKLHIKNRKTCIKQQELTGTYLQGPFIEVKLKTRIIFYSSVPKDKRFFKLKLKTQQVH